MEHGNGWCFRGIYKGGLWEDDLHVSAPLYRSHGLLYRANGFLYRAHGLLNRAHGLLYRANGLLYRALGILYRAHRLSILMNTKG